MRKTAAILGGGVIGGGWAARFLLMGWDVRVFDPDPEAERKIGEVLDNARRSLPALAEVAMPAEGTLTFSGSVADAVAEADWIQESVPERLALKRTDEGWEDTVPAFVERDFRKTLNAGYSPMVLVVPDVHAVITTSSSRSPVGQGRSARRVMHGGWPRRPTVPSGRSKPTMRLPSTSTNSAPGSAVVIASISAWSPWFWNARNNSSSRPIARGRW